MRWQFVLVCWHKHKVKVTYFITLPTFVSFGFSCTVGDLCIQQADIWKREKREKNSLYFHLSLSQHRAHHRNWLKQVLTLLKMIFYDNLSCLKTSFSLCCRSALLQPWSAGPVSKDSWFRTEFTSFQHYWVNHCSYRSHYVSYFVSVQLPWAGCTLTSE